MTQMDIKMPACHRCRLKKKKCDLNWPSCSNCAHLKLECVQFDKVLRRTFPRLSLFMENGNQHQTETQLALETGLRAVSDKQNSGQARKRPGSQIEKLASLSKKQKTIVDSPTPLLPESENFENNSNVDSMSVLFPESNMEKLSDYGDHISTRGLREDFIANEVKAVMKLKKDFLKAYRKNIVQDKATEITAYDKLLLYRVCKRYFTWMNSGYPVMHETTTYESFTRCINETASVFEQFQVKMVIAIALGTISRPQISHSEIGQVSRTFWKSAMGSSSKANAGILQLATLQNLLLLLQFTLLVPESGSLWHVSGAAMRYATGMSLYTELNPQQNFDALTLDLRRRMFWTCYCIDRTLSTVMGRPATVPDAWITAQLPSVTEDGNITQSGIAPGPTCNLKVAMVLRVGICRLQLEIHTKLYGPVTKPILHQEKLAQVTWTWQMYDRLRLWRNLFVLPTPLLMKEWTDLQFHVLVVLLLRPSPHRPSPSDEELHVAFHSAGEAMKLAKLMHRDQLAEFAWLSVQNLFMCGLTFINSLKEFSSRSPARKLCISFVDIVLQIQACTSMLETLAALKAGGDDRMRNVFETASSNTLHELAKNYANQPNKTGNCHWEVLAKSDNVQLQRPSTVDGVNVPVVTSLELPAPYRANDPRLRDFEELHFYSHDTDAQMSTLTSSTLGFLQNRLPEQDNSYFRSALLQRSSNGGEMAHTIFGMDGLAAISSLASETEPLVSSLGDETFQDSAELDRWFLYPI